MSDYRVRVLRTDAEGERAKAQPYRVRLEAANGEILMTSESYVNRTYAVQLAQRLAGVLDGTLIDETEVTEGP